MKKVYVLLADGFEILEAMGPVTIMKRGGLEVTTVSLNDTTDVISSHGITVKADIVFNSNDCKDGVGLFLPGGYPGYENLYKSDFAMDLAKFYLDNNKLLASICGAPSSLARKRFIDGRAISLHPSCHNLVGTYCEIMNSPITLDDNLLTATGAGYSVALGFAILSYLVPDKISEVKKQITLID